MKWGIIMPKQIFIVEPDSMLLSDLETMMLLHPDLELYGSSNLLSRAEEAVSSNPAICCVAIAQSVLDADCLTAIKRFQRYNVAILVMLDADCPPETRTSIELSENCTCIPKPFLETDFFAQVKKAVSNLSPIDKDIPDDIPTADDIEGMTPVLQEAIPAEPDYSNAELADNPYVNQSQVGNLTFNSSDLRDRFNEFKLNELNNEEEENKRIIPQKVIAIHNQKGGVGKSTIAIDLSVALTKTKITAIKDGVQYRPKVCVVDFDLDACDVATMLYLNPDEHRHSGTFANDLKLEAKRRTASKGKVEPIQSILFSERDIKEKYLIVHETGIYVLPAPTNKRESTQIHEDEVKAILNNLKACDFDIIVVDTGPNILDYTLATLVEADEIYAISTCELTSIYRLSAITRELQNLSNFKPNKTKLVINKYDPALLPREMFPERIGEVLRCEIYGVIPQFNELPNIRNDGYTVYNCRISVNKEDLERYTRAMSSLAKRTLGIKSVAPTQAPPPKKGLLDRAFNKLRRRKER